MDETEILLLSIASEGEKHIGFPLLSEIHPFKHFFNNGRATLDYSNLDRRDGSCTRRELVTRFLLLSAVLDQGPDIEGIRRLLVDVTNDLYANEVRFLHKPIDFFQELGIAIDRILENHNKIKGLRADIWAKNNNSSANKYNLFMDNTKQALNYSIFRWGVPLALPLLLEKEIQSSEEPSDSKPTALIDYLESFPSAETMSNKLKDHEKYGLGKAIGNKACHLFAKWFVSSFNLCRKSDLSWKDFSYEVPYDSNAGRVLWRTGYFLNWADESFYQKKEVLQPKKGKDNLCYIRVTNIRGNAVQKKDNLPEDIKDLYYEVSQKHLKTHKTKPRKFEIQRIQHAFLLKHHRKTNLNISNFDDGLIYIGTNYCYNHSEPKCSDCPIKNLCLGYKNKELIENYRT